MKSLVPVLILVLMAAGISATAAKPNKVLVCHVDPDPEPILDPITGEIVGFEDPNPHVINISENAVPAHLGHGDRLAVEGEEKGDSCLP